MPRLIFKCPHLKGGGHNAAHLSNYVKYMATRENAQRIDPGKANWPATQKQQEMVARLLRDFPLSRGMFEYADYQAAPTRANASEFIGRAMEDNLDQLGKRENYVDYIAHRPRAEKVGAHALFHDREEHLVLEQVAREVAGHAGTVWLPILSLRREDAARLGYDNAQRWQALLSSHAAEIADAMKIPWEHFRWYAAFHDESHHPHVHMVVYSADGKSGFLNKAGIATIKSTLAKDIFQQELTEIYQRQTKRRDDLVVKSRERMEQLIREMRGGALESERLELLLQHLAQRLKAVKGKKQYGYLKPELKSVVDEIVEELARDPRIAEAYDLWYEMREEVLRTYKDDLPERLPLSRQKEFKQIRNMIIQEAERIEPPSVEEMIWLYEQGQRGNAQAKRQFEQKAKVPQVSVTQSVTRLLHHAGQIFQEQTPHPKARLRSGADSKLRRRIREKKIAMGHKPDDREEQVQRQSL